MAVFEVARRVDMPGRPSYSDAPACPLPSRRPTRLDTQATVLEAELLRRVAARDQSAFDALYDRYAPVVFGVALQVLGTRQDAEDVVIDVFAQVWRTADRYDSRRARVDGWLLMMTRSRSLDRLRQRQRDHRVEDAAEAEAEAQPVVQIEGPEHDALIAERRAAVVAALGALPVAQREPLELAYYKGLSQSEIADATGEALGTVKTRMRLGMAKLREALAAWWSV